MSFLREEWEKGFGDLEFKGSRNLSSLIAFPFGPTTPPIHDRMIPLSSLFRKWCWDTPTHAREAGIEASKHLHGLQGRHEKRGVLQGLNGGCTCLYHG